MFTELFVSVLDAESISTFEAISSRNNSGLDALSGTIVSNVFKIRIPDCIDAQKRSYLVSMYSEAFLRAGLVEGVNYSYLN